MKKRDINILIVDDDASIRKVLSEAVKKFGYTALVASGQDEAMSFARIKPIHAALVDCLLPKINGIDLVKKLRDTRFGQSPVILMSGIFRDRTFASDAIDKSKAVEFLFKPLDLGELEKHLNKHLSDLLSETTIPLHALISKGFDSPRERRKAIEMLEEISGFDLPFVLSVLMDAKVGGHLNIVNQAGEIYGISLSKGKVVAVDSSEAAATLTLLLIQKGFVTNEDIQLLVEKGARGDILKTLLDEALISPHAVPIVRTEQILTNLKRLFIEEKVQFNFSPERGAEDLPGVDLDALIPHFQDAITNSITLKYLMEFYDGWGDYPIVEGPAYSQSEEMKKYDLIKKATGILSVAHEQVTINELIAADRFNKKDLLRALHLLALKRVIIFDTMKRGTQKEDLKSRFEHMLKGIDGKSPKEIFVYFGASQEAKADEVDKIYMEFAKNNHPDKLHKTVAEDVRKLVNKVFSLVSSAHSILTDPKKRLEFEEKLKQKEAHQQMQAEELVEKGLDYLRKGRFQDSFKIMQEAYSIYKGMNVMLYFTWAETKAFPEMDKARIDKMLDRMNTIPHEDRRNALYQFVSGLIKKVQGDLVGACACYDKALTYDVDFLDARRELVSLRQKGGKTVSTFTAKDLLHADLGEIVGSLFKKKG